jgi:hypothetical protein
VEHVQKGSRKAQLAGDAGGGLLGSVFGKGTSTSDVFKMGMDLLDEFSDTKR